MDKPTASVVLALCIFDIHNHAKTVFERYCFHFWIRKLLEEGIRHGSEAHLDKLVYGTLINHWAYLHNNLHLVLSRVYSQKMESLQWFLTSFWYLQQLYS